MKPTLVFDSEVYANYYLLAFKNLDTGNVVTFERTPDQDLDVEKITRILESYTLISFNGWHFDLPVLAMAMTGASNAQIKQVCDEIITGGKKSWQIYREHNLTQFDIDHIDLIEVAPGQIGLKQYAGRLHAATLQDLPIEPDAEITVEQRDLLKIYCVNDLALTELLYRHLLPQIDLRREMTAQYGIDLRSKSDAQIAEAVIKHEVEAKSKRRIVRPVLPANTRLIYNPPEWISFSSRACQTALDLIRDAEFRLDNLGSPAMPPALENATVRIGTSVYRLGIGGLHSTESSVCHYEDENTVLIDRDVASYYPSIILRCGLAPSQMGDPFLEVYRGIVERRLAAKHAGDKTTADTLKIVVNGSYGKLGSKWSVLYAPALMLQVTLTGQLALLMLIENLEAHGIPVVSANTDGIVIKCPRVKVAEMDAIVCWWETVTGFDTEATEYAALYSRDVNNYIAIKPDGKVKTKGQYASASLAKSPANEICVEAVINRVKTGTPTTDTIDGCKDIRKFVSLRQVKGGALDQEGRYLGKVVRWYYSTTATGPLTYRSNGYTVARTDGARALMTLPDTLPADLDRGWYVREAESILLDIGCSNC